MLLQPNESAIDNDNENDLRYQTPKSTHSISICQSVDIDFYNILRENVAQSIPDPIGTDRDSIETNRMDYYFCHFFSRIEMDSISFMTFEDSNSMDHIIIIETNRNYSNWKMW